MGQYLSNKSLTSLPSRPVFFSVWQQQTPKVLVSTVVVFICSSRISFLSLALSLSQFFFFFSIYPFFLFLFLFFFFWATKIRNPETIKFWKVTDSENDRNLQIEFQAWSRPITEAVLNHVHDNGQVAKS